MKTIQKYIIREILGVFFIILLAIAIFILISNLLDRMPMIMQHKPPVHLIAAYFLCGMPFLIAESMPFAMLLSILFVFAQFNRHNELVAMESAGISFYSIAGPVLGLAFTVSVAGILMNETLVSASYEKANYIKETLIEKKTSGSKEIRYDLAKLGTGGRIFYIQKFDGFVGMMTGVCILTLDKDFNLLERL
ncbi:MAG TPA: LptF/LptG family permease, partial [Candidatus Goldiibacteriota bacterium]|nr:LptF/LptG family permease [Candidatus Goldiibacteriota bacterium]